MAKFVFTLIDKFTGPSRGITRVIDSIAASSPRAARALALLDRGLGAVGAGAKRTFGAMRAAASTLAPVALEAGKALGIVGGAAAGFVVAGGRLLVGAQSFRDTTQAALAFALGSAKAGSDAYGEILRISQVLGASSAEAAGNFRELTAAGFGERESKILLQLADDLKAAAGGQAVSISAIAEPLQALKRNEALTVDSFKGLEAAGMGRDRLYKVLAAQLKVAIKNPDDTNKIKADVDRALASQQLRGQKAVDFWAKVNMSALDVTKLGERGETFRKTTVDGSIDLIKNRWENLWKSINTGDSGKELVDVLQKVANLMDPASDGGKELRGTIEGLVAGGRDLYNAIKPLGSGLFDGLDEARITVRQLGEELGWTGASATISAGALSNIGKALGYVVVGVGLTIGALAWLGATIVEAVGTLPENMRFIGRELIAGLGEGIESMKGWLVAKLESLASLLPDSVRKLLKIRSPSKVFAEIGMHTAEGMAVGVEAGAGRVEGAAQGLAEAARGGASGAGPSTGAGARPPLSLPPGLVQITINGSPSSADLAEIEARVRAAMIAAFREAGLELGAPA